MARSRSRAARPLGKLETHARQAFERGDLDEALAAFTQLEERDAENPEWPRQLANLHQRAGRTDAELDALVRCGDRHAARAEFLPALATYKMVLSTDPGHTTAQQRLSELQPSSNSVAVTYIDEQTLRPPPPPAEPIRERRGRDRRSQDRRAASSAPLDELVLTEIVEGTRPAHLTDCDLEGIHEIPLDDELGERPSRDGRGRAAVVTADLDLDPTSVAQLEQSALFSSLDRQSLAQLVENVLLVELEAGEELFHQGDTGGALYIVAKGAVVPIAEGEPRTRLAVLEAGEFFGEIALFTNQPRNATIEALVDTQLLAIDRSVMWDLVQEHSTVLSLLLQFLRERLIHRLVRTSPLFQIFSQTKRSAIARRFRFLEVSDGHSVIEQHHPAEAVFILLSGCMGVVHTSDNDPNDVKVLASLGPGDLFGEMSLLWREPSLASVTARGKCWLLALPAQSFQQMLDHHPELAELAARIAKDRRQQNKRTLRDALAHRDGKAGLI